VLVTLDWTFLHIPKTGGTSVRHGAEGFEVSEILPMGLQATASHHFHWIGAKRPPGEVFTVVRHPADWIASYWKMRKHEGVLDMSKRLDRLWVNDLDAFARNVINRAPGYVGRLFTAYARAYDGVTVYRLEDGLERITGREARRNRLDGPAITGTLRRHIENAEPVAMEWY
jgi:hypothetical protein